MILKALYDYYNRCGDLPMPGMEEKEIGFIIVLSKEGRFASKIAVRVRVRQEHIL